MGNYNPYSPQIVGQEWVPIRDEGLIFNPFANTLERGYSFTLNQSTQVSTVAFYMKEFPDFFASSSIITAAIYPRGKEAQSGPIRSVTIPCSYAQATGGTGTFSSNTGPYLTFAGLTYADALYARGDNYFVNWQMGDNSTVFRLGLAMWFATNAYGPLLNGKRILGVDFLTGYNMTFQGLDIEGFPQTMRTLVRSDGAGFDASDTFRLPDLLSNSTPVSTIQDVRMHLGDTNRFLGTTFSTTTAGINQIAPWTWNELRRFEASSPNRLFIVLEELSNIAAFGPTWQCEYAGMEVFYCEEQRIAFGSRIFNDDIPNRPSRDAFVLGANYIAMRDSATLAINPVLPAGNYTLTVSQSNMGDSYYASLYRGVITLNETRQLYEIPSHPGVQINLPFPLDDDTIGSEFTATSSDLIPQLSMHASGGAAVIPASQVYGQQSAAQVYGNVVALQEIDDRSIPSASYPWTRFLARRFGNTSTPLRLDFTSPSLSGASRYVQITPADFDALDDVIDGWKQISLEFTNPPTLGNSTIPVVRWSSFGETAGNRWEVLGATAPAVSGIPFQMDINLQFGQVPIGQRLYLGTYGGPVSGGVINETWLPQWGPYVSGSAVDDPASDASVMFSQYMPTITGFAVSMGSQAISGIGLDCGIAPCGIPTHILYPQLSWSQPVNSGIASDAFSRTASSSWGTPDRGGPYTLSGNATQYSVNGAEGLMTPDSVGAYTNAQLSSIGVNFDVTVKLGLTNPIVATSTASTGILGRYTSNNSHYAGYVFFDPSVGSTTINIDKYVGGVYTALDSRVVTNIVNINAGARVYVRFMGSGSLLKIKVWRDTVDEPSMWNAEVTDTSLTSGTSVVLTSMSNNVLGNTFAFDNLIVRAPEYWFGYYEMQRMDDVTSWRTIMKASTPAVISFKDFEARTDMATSYRIRGVNYYGFVGPWSSTVSITVVSPGVSGSCFNNGEHVMIFTTNERQDGSANLAYSNVWENEVTEEFSFAEAGFIQLQPMYDRDFFTAFRPRERGGDQFSRDLLVQAAAIAPETLSDFTSLRDMAWEDVSYICVRDEEGNRWFASVNVPAGVVKNRRRLYLATIQVVEVTDTPSPVDPTWP